jgi:ketosteroid isomerase-like protein
MPTADTDDAAIRNLIASMAFATDDGSLESYAALLSEGCTWQMPGGDPVVGRAAIVESARTRRETGALGPGSGTRHHVTTVAVHVDGDTASSEALWQFWGGLPATPALKAMGRYRDTFTRTPEGWRYASRVGTVG